MNTDACRLYYSINGVDNFLNLYRTKFFATNIDKFFFTTDQMKISFIVFKSPVTSAEVIAEERVFICGFTITPIIGAYISTLDTHFALCTYSCFMAFFAENLNFCVGSRLAD